MDVGDIVVGLVAQPLLGAHIVHVAVIHLDPLDAVARNHAPTIGLDDLSQRIGKVAAATHKATGTVDVERADDGVHVGWGLLAASAVEGIHIGQHAAQFRIADVLGDEVVGRHHKHL